MNRTCSFTGKNLSKENTYRSSDGTYMDVNVKHFLDSIPELPIESLEILIKEASLARKVKLTKWQKFLNAIRFGR